MIDFGLAGLFERFEKTLGRRLTFGLTVVIALAVSTVCLGIIFAGASKAFGAVHGILFPEDGSNELVNGLIIFGLTFLATAIAAIIVSRAEVARLARRAHEVNSNGLSLMKRAEATHQLAIEKLDKAEQAALMIEELTSRVEALYQHSVGSAVQAEQVIEQSGKD